MYPILFEIPGLGFGVPSFGVMVALGFLLGIQVATRLFRRFGDKPETDPDNFAEVAVAILIGIVVGARALYVLVEVCRYLTAEAGPKADAMIGHTYLTEPWTIFMVWKGGLVMYGGLTGGVLFGLWSGIKHEMKPISGLDIGITAGFFGLAIGRIGCYLVGDDYGRVVPEGTSLGFPITFTVPPIEWLNANPRSLLAHDLADKTLWCTQLWMCANALCIFAFGLFLLKRRRYGGHTTLWLVFVYAVTRFAIEAFRGDEIRGVWFGFISTSQLISIAVGTIAAALLFKNRGRLEPMPGARPIEPAASAP